MQEDGVMLMSDQDFYKDFTEIFLGLNKEQEGDVLALVNKFGECCKDVKTKIVVVALLNMIVIALLRVKDVETRALMIEVINSYIKIVSEKEE
jgi:hypothetical protein